MSRILKKKTADIIKKTSINPPWKRQSPMTLTSNPRAPTATRSSGSSIGSRSIKRLHASTVILKHSATRNTALTRAPSTSALAHPKVFLDHFFGDIWKKSKWVVKLIFVSFDRRSLRRSSLFSPLQTEKRLPEPRRPTTCENYRQLKPLNLLCSQRLFLPKRRTPSAKASSAGDIFFPCIVPLLLLLIL